MKVKATVNQFGCIAVVIKDGKNIGIGQDKRSEVAMVRALIHAGVLTVEEDKQSTKQEKDDLVFYYEFVQPKLSERDKEDINRLTPSKYANENARKRYEK